MPDREEIGRQTDVLVVGGGPAGLYAAQLLASRKLSVRVLEEHEEIGEPEHCTGIVGAETLALPGVPGDCVAGWLATGRFHSPAGHCFTYSGPPDEVCVVDRSAFDKGLARRAGLAGAAIETGTRAVDLEVHDDGATVHARRHGRLVAFSASACVLACGAQYRFQRRLGWGRPSLFLAAAQAEVRCAGGEALDVFFRPELAPRGFAWLVPFRRGADAVMKAGVMAASRPARALERLVAELARAGRVRSAGGRSVVRLLPLGPLARTYGPRVVAIGDAAGLVKPTTGGGIYYSLRSASWAAETLCEAFARGDFGSRCLAGYEDRWRSNLGLELSVGMWFRRLAGWLTPGDLDALTRLAIEDGVVQVIRANARFDAHRELIWASLRHPGILDIVVRRLLGRIVGRGAPAASRAY